MYSVPYFENLLSHLALRLISLPSVAVFVGELHLVSRTFLHYRALLLLNQDKRLVSLDPFALSLSCPFLPLTCNHIQGIQDPASLFVAEANSEERG